MSSLSYYSLRMMGGFFLKIKINSRLLALLAVLTAIGVVLGRFVPLVNILTSKYEFSFVAVMLAGYLTGPVGGAVVGGLVDLIGALLVPTGAYFPGFTATAALAGMIFGFALRNKCTLPNIIGAVLANQIFCTLIFNTFFISELFSPKGFTALLAARAVQAAVMAVIQIVFGYIFLVKIDLKKLLKI